MLRRSPAPPAVDDRLLLPRPPGLVRRFWSRHPVVADVLIALVALFLSTMPVASVRAGLEPAPGAVAWAPAPDVAAAIVTASTLLASGTLLVRRRWPLVPMAAATAAQLTFLLSPVAMGAPLLMIAVYAVAVYSSSRACWQAFGMVSAVIAACSAAATAAGVATASAALNTSIGGIVLMLIGALLGVNVGGRRRYLEAIIDRSRQLLVERDQQAQLAAAAERARIARELHDIVSHSLTVVIALAEGAGATADADRARAATALAAQTARDALGQMRTMLGVLRDTEADAPLAPAEDVSVQDVVEAARRAGFAVTLETTGDLGAPAPVRLAVYRIAQEGLTNAMRHAPRATGIAVRIAAGADRVHVEIRNDGVTSPPREGGFGLRGLRERVAHLDGAIQAGPDGPGRWAIRAVVPLDAGAS